METKTVHSATCLLQ